MNESNQAVFLSYASQDAEAARRICDSLRQAGVEVWFDQSELRGGDAWDAKIRQQIRECALFVPIISVNTQARREGYFRIEWKLAAQRTYAIAEGTPFLLPLVIDDTPEPRALVPAEFREVQWTRVRGGNLSPEFCARVQAMLAGDSGSQTSSSAPNRSRPLAPAAPRTPPRRRAARWLAAAAILAAIGLGVWQTWRKNAGGPNAAVATAPLSEARKLAAKADALFDHDERSSRENLALAEKFCQQAIALDPNDPEVWSVFSRVGSYFIYQTYDRSDARRVQAGNAATRAARLAPNSFEARFAQAYFYRLDDSTYREAERILRQLLEERPDDRRVWRTLGRTLRSGTIFAVNWRGRDAEAVECFRRAVALPGPDPLSLNVLATTLGAMGRMDEAEKAVNDSIAAKPNGSAYSNKMNIMLRYGGNVAKAQEALSHVPVEQLREDRDAFLAFDIWLCARQPDKAIEVLRALPRNYLEAAFDGPKGVLLGQAHALAGRSQAAEIEWRAALQVVDQRLAGEPNSARLLVWRAWLFAHLGEQAEARRLLGAVEQLGVSARDAYPAAGIALATGDPAKAVTLLASAIKAPAIATRAYLRIQPAWDSLRGDARFQALIAEVAGVPSADQKSIAVLAFENRSSEKDSEYFSDGISEELLNVLAKVPGLRVIGRASSFQFKGGKAAPAEIGQKLNVTHLVEGSVQRVGARARITAQLTLAATGQTLWSEKFDTELKDIFATQDEIAGFIADKLSLSLGAAPRRMKTVHPEAHGRLLEGRHYFAERNYDSFAPAEAALQAALQLDPQFAEAHAALGMLLITRDGYSQTDGMVRPPGQAAMGIAEARRALELDPTLAEGYLAIGYAGLWRGNFAEAELQLRKALAINPNSPEVRHYLALVLSCMGQLGDSIEEHRRAATLDPLGWLNLQNLSRALFWAEEYAGALVVNERARTLRGASVFIPNRGEHARLSLQLGRLNEAAEAARYLREHPAVYPRWQHDSAAIRVLWLSGHKQEASDYAQELFKKWAADHYQRGFVLSALDRFAEGLPFLERSPAQAIRYLYWDERWDRWREDPRFIALIEKLGRTAEYKVARDALARLQKERRGQK